MNYLGAVHEPELSRTNISFLPSERGSQDYQCDRYMTLPLLSVTSWRPSPHQLLKEAWQTSRRTICQKVTVTEITKEKVNTTTKKVTTNAYPPGMDVSRYCSVRSHHDSCCSLVGKRLGNTRLLCKYVSYNQNIK